MVAGYIFPQGSLSNGKLHTASVKGLRETVAAETHIIQITSIYNLYTNTAMETAEPLERVLIVISAKFMI